MDNSAEQLDQAIYEEHCKCCDKACTYYCEVECYYNN